MEILDVDVVSDNLVERGILFQYLSEFNEGTGSLSVLGLNGVEEFHCLTLLLPHRIVREGLSTPHALVFVPRRLLLAPGTLDRGDRVRLVLLDVHSVCLGNSSVVRVAEDRDVVSGDLAPALPAVMIFEVRLTDALRGEERRARLSHPSPSDVCVVDAGFSRGLLHHLRFHLVRNVGAVVEVAPEWCCRVVSFAVLSFRRRRPGVRTCGR